jgi:hypothetical protein
LAGRSKKDLNCLVKNKNGLNGSEVQCSGAETIAFYSSSGPAFKKVSSMATA